MSQYDFGTIDATVVDGTALAAILNNWRNAIYTSQRGASRPAFVVPGQLWVNDSGGPSNWIVNLYVSSTLGDRPLFTVNTVSGSIVWGAGISGGPFLPLAGGTVSGPMTFQNDVFTQGVDWSDKVTGQPVKRYRAQANAANQRIFEIIEQADGTLHIRAMADNLSTVQGELQINRDGTMLGGTPPVGAVAGELATASWVLAKIAGIGAAGPPTGLIAPFGGASAPTGWLLCDGSLVSTTTYAALFAVLGTTFGAGSGTFGLPDLRGRAPFGADAMGGSAANRLGSGPAGGITVPAVRGAAGGQQSHQLSVLEQATMPVSGGGGPVSGLFAADSSGGAPSVTQIGGNTPITGITAASGGNAVGGGSSGQAHNVIPPSLVVSYIIKT